MRVAVLILSAVTIAALVTFAEACVRAVAGRRP